MVQRSASVSFAASEPRPGATLSTDESPDSANVAATGTNASLALPAGDTDGRHASNVSGLRMWARAAALALMNRGDESEAESSSDEEEDAVDVTNADALFVADEAQDELYVVVDGSDPIGNARMGPRAEKI